MSTTRYNWRLLGATRSVIVPTIDGEYVGALLTVSPQTGWVTLVDLLKEFDESLGVILDGQGPRSAVVDAVREEGWILCDSGLLVRYGTELPGTPRLVEQDRLLIGAKNFARWLILAQSAPDIGNRISDSRNALLPATGLAAAQRLRRTDNPDTPLAPVYRLIDVASNRLVIAPIGPGTIAAYNTEQNDIVEVSRLSGLSPRVESAAFDDDTGYLYAVDSRGTGHIVQLMPNNVLRDVGIFEFKNVEGPFRAQVIDSQLFVTCERRNRVLVWDLTDPEVPLLADDRHYDSAANWEKNPVVMVNVTDGVTVQKFGTLPILLDHGDFPVGDMGEYAWNATSALVWALHPELGAITYRPENGVAIGGASGANTARAGAIVWPPQPIEYYYGWGQNNAGQLGNGLVATLHVPTLIGSTFVTVSAGRDHSLGLTANGDLYGWGTNSDGQVGDGTTTNRLTPVFISSGWAEAHAGVLFSVGRKTDGTLWTWGRNIEAQLGDGTLASKHAPVQIGTGYVSCSAGSLHSQALKADGKMYGWGYNNYGQIGIYPDVTLNVVTPTLITTVYNTATSSFVPAPIWAKVFSGFNASIGFSVSGLIHYAGADVLGNASVFRKAFLSPLKDLSWKKVALGQGFLLLLTNSGDLWAWGDNSFGQLGNGTTTNQTTQEVPIFISSGWSDIATGNFHSFGLKPNGDLYAWGDNGAFKLGDGTQTNRLSPTLVGTHFTEARGGFSFSLGLRSVNT